MKIAVASLRTPKVEAVRSAFGKMNSRLNSAHESVEFIARKTDSGVSNMPMSIQELMQGARLRVADLRRQLTEVDSDIDFYVGLEGGFFLASAGDEPRTCFLQSWVYVSNGTLGCYGGSGAVPVPGQIAREILTNDRELGDIIDRFARQKNVRNRQGAFGVFTQGVVTRKIAFETALLHALSPFCNKQLYQG